MRENNITQTSLANAIGFSQRAVSKWVNEETEPTETAIRACAEFFEVSADEMLGISPAFRQTPTIARTSEENTLLSSFNNLNKTNKARILAYIQFVLEEQKR